MSTETTETDHRSWIRERATVLHLPSGAIGAATAYHEPGAFVSPVNGKRVHSPVLMLGEHAFIATSPSIAFRKLSDVLTELYASFAEQHAELLKQTMRLSAVRCIDPKESVTVILSVLREQLRALEVP